MNIEEVLPELCSDKDLYYIGLDVGKVHVLDEIYELIGEISPSSSDDEVQMDEHLENYLTNHNIETLDSQSMARMKQTVRKQSTLSHGSPPAVIEPSNELNLDSSLARAYNTINDNYPDVGSKDRGAASHSSPWQGQNRGFNLDGGGAGRSGESSRGQRLKQLIESESSEEEPTSSEEFRRELGGEATSQTAEEV